MLQSMLISAWHSPVQLAEHFASHVAVGGVALQLVLHWPEQVALHSAVHLAWSAAEAHLPSQVPWQSAVQDALQSKDPGSALQFAMQLVLQLPVHVASAVTLHWPWQVTVSCASQEASKETFVHCAWQSGPVTFAWQVALAETSMFPQLSIPARAGSATEETARAERSPASRRVVFMGKPPVRWGTGRRTALLESVFDPAPEWHFEEDEAEGARRVLSVRISYRIAHG